MSVEITSAKPSVDDGVGANPFELRSDVGVSASDPHLIRDGVICDTESRGRATPRRGSPMEIVLDASEGFIPLWANGTTLRWRFHEPSLAQYRDPAALRAAIETLFAEALLLWGDAAPVRFSRDDDAWDFEIAVRAQDKCDARGCVLARAFFPDAGRHQLVIFPKMFAEPREEQVETLAHEIGHIFGLRHFFALVSETGAPAVVFGRHGQFSIMNYGVDSRMSDADREDLKDVYRQAWAGTLTSVNGTPIRLVTPFHASGFAMAGARA